MGNDNQVPQRENISDVIKKYKEMNGVNSGNETRISNPITGPTGIDLPKSQAFNQQDFERVMSKETDPDLMTSFEVIKLPSKGLFYKHGISEVNVEYMTSRDEDLLTTPSLIENGTVLNTLLKRKIKTPGINADELLPGDRDALILFLRTSSYGPEYGVQLSDPRTGIPFKTNVDLTKLKYKEMEILPDENGYFHVEIPMRKKIVTFRLMSHGEDNQIFKKAEAIKEAYNQEFSDYSTMKLKAHIVAINDKTDRSYIDKFVDAMPALDGVTIRRKILEVSPGVDMNYEFTAKDGYKFSALLSVGIDFFFPST